LQRVNVFDHVPLQREDAHRGRRQFSCRG
jgi:hypothetical protein